MNIICIIPARGGSKELPKKNIVEFCGKPLIAWSILQAKASKYIKEVYVSSDNKEILKISEESGAKIIKRPKTLATDTSPSEEALQHAIHHIQKLNNEKMDIVVFLQATSPLRANEDIDKAIRLFLTQKADSLFSAVLLGEICLWETDQRNLKSLTFDYKNRSRRQDRKPYYLENGSIYIFKPKILEKYKNRLGGKIVVYRMDYWKAHQIDNLEDIEICTYFMKKKIFQKEHEIDIKKIQLIVYDFDGVLTDNKVLLSEQGFESVIVNRSDGMAMELLKRKGVNQLILTTETNKVVEERAKKLGILAIRGIKNKKEALIAFCQENELPLENVVYIGNDLNDLEAMKIVAYPVCPSDAGEEVKNISKIILSSAGGTGVVRELIRHIKFNKRGRS